MEWKQLIKKIIVAIIIFIILSFIPVIKTSIEECIGCEPIVSYIPAVSSFLCIFDNDCENIGDSLLTLKRLLVGEFLIACLISYLIFRRFQK
ncbi:MAG: hypothetical protein PHF86_11465 [Candidatus Nanoarchaeia archaeon]|nr:hypothetical protein [Candidatus Nanoarchaeia archaeon]